MKPFIKISQQLVGLPYELGKVDCFALILTYLEILGFEPPKRFKGYTRESYPKLFKKDPEKAYKIMVAFIEKYLDEIAPGKAFCGDVMLLSQEDSPAFPFLAINGGNANIISATENGGVDLTPLHYYQIERVFRWVNPHNK